MLGKSKNPLSLNLPLKKNRFNKYKKKIHFILGKSSVTNGVIELD